MFLINFIACILFNETKIINRRLEYLKYLIININFKKYFFYILGNKNINPIKSVEFNNFIQNNEKKWKKINNDYIKINNEKIILIDNFISHSVYTLNNISIGKYVSYFYKSNCAGFLRKGDIKGEVIFRSFGIKKFYYLNDGNIIQRCKYLIKALFIASKFKTIKDFCNFKIDGIDIGLTAYDTFIRYTRIPSSKKIKLKMIIILSEAIYTNNFLNNLFKEKKITKIVQAERQFIPYCILFQKSLKKGKKVFTNLGTDTSTVRIYNKFNQRYDNKNNFSIKLINLILKNNKIKSLKKIENFYKLQFKNKVYGKSWGNFVQQNKKIISQWKKNEDLKFKTKSVKGIDLKLMNKDQICKICKWDKNKKIVTVFLPYFVDGNFQHGRKKLFKDNFSWTINTLKIIENIKNVNWLIRQHPSESRFDTKINFTKIIKDIETKHSHIRFSPRNINPVSLKNITDIALTSHGSVGLEYPSFGIPCIVAEKSYYTHCKFNDRPTNISEYKDLLNNINKVKKLNKKNIELARIFLFIFLILARVRNSMLPDWLPFFESRMRVRDEKYFWNKTLQSLKKFSFLENNFKKMLEKQINYKLRHTINTDFYSIKKKLNDF